MNKRFYKIFALTLILLSILDFPLRAQTFPVSFATWKDNNKAAYTIIHDDFGDVTTAGIVKYADTIAANRGIKLTFGAITGYCDATDWANARKMIARGHECINHSHNHKCGGDASQCSGLATYGPADFATELDLSTQLIATNTGVVPRFFIHPYDAASTAIIDRLKALGYLGTRAGTQEQINPGNFSDPYRMNFHVFRPNSTLSQLNASVTAAVNGGGYCIRELHGVADQSWGKVSLSNYRSHMNFVKTQMNLKNIWSATVSEVLTYKMQRDAFQPVATYNSSSGTIIVSFTTLKPIDTTDLRSPVTLNLLVTGSSTNFAASQNGVAIPYTRRGDMLTLNIYPHKGNVIFSGNIAPPPPPPPPPACIADGKLVRWTWNNLTINNWNLTDLKTDARYPNSPSGIDTITEFRALDRGDSYGERVYGYIKAPKSGAYTFWITGDDDVELYFSATGDSTAKTKICGFQGFTDYAEYAKFPSQKSATVNLAAGKYYYVEALHIGTVGATNHFHVYWTMPGSTSQEPIISNVLASRNCDIINNQPTPKTSRLELAIDFNGRLEGDKAMLNWSSKNLLEDDYFIIEKANVQTGEFEELATIDAINYSNSTHYFSHIDDRLNEGSNLYRLKTIGSDGAIHVSNVAKLVYEPLKSYTIFPNPAYDYIDIDLSSVQGKNVEISVHSLIGKAVYQEKIQEAGSNIHHIELRNLESGQYVVRIQAAGKKAVMKKLVIIK